MHVNRQLELRATWLTPQHNLTPLERVKKVEKTDPLQHSRLINQKNYSVCDFCVIDNLRLKRFRWWFTQNVDIFCGVWIADSVGEKIGGFGCLRMVSSRLFEGEFKDSRLEIS